MTDNIKYWYVTADVSRINKETKEVLEQKTFSRADWTRKNFFPLTGIVKLITITLLDRCKFFNPNEEFCSVRIVNQVEISEEDYKELSDDFGFLSKGGQLI